MGGLKQLILRWGLVAFLAILLEVSGGPFGLRPSSILISSADLLSSGQLLPHLVRSLQEIIVSFLLASILGVPLGVLLWKVSALGKMLEPYLVALYAVPLILFYPFFLVLLGLGPAPIIVVATAMGIIPIVVNTSVGLAQVRDVFHKLGRSMCCSRPQRYLKILLPAATPSIFTGLKLGFIYSLIGAVATEFITSNAGIGFSVYYHYNAFQSDLMYAYMLVIVVLAALFNLLLGKAEAKIRREMT